MITINDKQANIKLKTVIKNQPWRSSLSVVLMSLVATPIMAMSSSEVQASQDSNTPNNVIFFHPDGYGFNHWNNLRTFIKGPDGKLNWDRLPYMAPYTGHMKDALTGSSHGGATVHAYGVKVARNSFGLDRHAEITALSGKNKSIMEEAINAGFATALVGSGSIVEPGTAVFVSSVQERNMRAEIAKQVIESGVYVILSGGEQWLLPENVTGVHGKGKRTDGINLIDRAKELGYTVVYNKEELFAARKTATKLLGVFASNHTFNDTTEENLRKKGLPLYVYGSPTIAEMSAVALEVLARNPKSTTKGKFLVVEEEGTDNFGNNANARGSFEAGKRSDIAFGVFLDFLEKNPNTLLITTADSSAGGKHILGNDARGMKRYIQDGLVTKADINSGYDGKYVTAPVDGIDGANTPPFIAAADKAGKQLPFVVTWASRRDVSGGVLVRAKGMNANKVTELGVVDSTDIYRIMYYSLFNKWLPKK